MITYAGLALIVLGWAFQLLSKDKRIKPSFVLVYALGACVLAIDGFMNDQPVMALLNAVSVVLALIVLLKSIKKN